MLPTLSLVQGVSNISPAELVPGVSGLSPVELVPGVSGMSLMELVPGVSGMSSVEVECGEPIWLLLFLFFLGTAAPGSTSLSVTNMKITYFHKDSTRHFALFKTKKKEDIIYMSLRLEQKKVKSL